MSTTSSNAIRPIPPTFSSFLDQFENMAKTYPDKVAVVFEESSITYGSLNARANQVGNFLSRKGIGPESPVVVYLDRSLELPIVFLGILKAGGVYIPFDPHFTPLARLSSMVKTVNPAIILTTSQFRSHFPKHQTRLFVLKEIQSQIGCESPTPPSSLSAPENLAYIMHTSGSTGLPKGVMITQANLSHYVDAMQLSCSVNPTDRYLHTASFAFSSSIRQLTVPLSCAATLVIATSTHLRDPLDIFHLMKTRLISIIDIVPSFWKNCLESLESLDSTRATSLLSNNLRLILSASEALPHDVVFRWKTRSSTGHERHQYVWTNRNYWHRPYPPVKKFPERFSTG